MSDQERIKSTPDLEQVAVFEVGQKVTFSPSQTEDDGRVVFGTADSEENHDPKTLTKGNQYEVLEVTAYDETASTRTGTEFIRVKSDDGREMRIKADWFKA